MGDMSGKVAIITGAAMGIGRATAIAFGQAGAAVIVADVDEAGGRQTASDVDGAGGKGTFIRCDVRSMADFEAVAAATLAAHGRIDVLVNNAGRALGGVVDETDEAAWNEVIDTNLTSVWRGMKVVVPQMRRQGAGSIVNVSSVQSLRGFHGWAGYAATKGGINALTQQTAVELAPAGIRVNAVAPGTIMTPLNEKVFRESKDPQGLIDRWNAAHPIGRFGEAHEVAELILFLASDRASFITGELVRVDGGLVVKGD